MLDHICMISRHNAGIFDITYKYVMALEEVLMKGEHELGDEIEELHSNLEKLFSLKRLSDAQTLELEEKILRIIYGDALEKK